MKNATDNAGELINDLQLVYNKAVRLRSPKFRKSSAALPRFKNGSNIQRNQT